MGPSSLLMTSMPATPRWPSASTPVSDDNLDSAPPRPSGQGRRSRCRCRAGVDGPGLKPTGTGVLIAVYRSRIDSCRRRHGCPCAALLAAPARPQSSRRPEGWELVAGTRGRPFALPSSDESVSDGCAEDWWKTLRICMGSDDSNLAMSMAWSSKEHLAALFKETEAGAWLPNNRLPRTTFS